jgi:hypothetical protein
MVEQLEGRLTVSDSGRRAVVSFPLDDGGG